MLFICFGLFQQNLIKKTWSYQFPYVSRCSMINMIKHNLGELKMKKMIKIAFTYAILAMVAGVFYREFTKFNGFDGRTTLSFMHTHLFMLGMMMFLMVSLFVSNYKIHEHKKFKLFMIAYNIGVPLTVIMMLIRGIVQVLAINVTTGISAAISGISGIGHIFTGVGIIFLFLSILGSIKSE